MQEKTWKLFRCLFFVFFGFFLLLYLPEYSEARNFMWRVSARKSTVYILGSIHLLKKDVYPLDRAIEYAFDRSDYLSVEADIGDMGNIDLGGFLTKALYPGDDTIANHLSSEAVALVKEQMERLGLPPETVMKQKPWLLALIIPSLTLMNAGYDPEYGIDKHFLNKARGDKKILELESLNYQLNLLSGFSDKEQGLLLLYEIKDLENLTREVDSMVKAWQAGDVQAIEGFQTKTMGEDKRFYPIYDKLINVRNKGMTAKIEKYLESSGTYFVIVGAGHLVGNKGIIQLLRTKGYKVDQQ